MRRSYALLAGLVLAAALGTAWWVRVPHPAARAVEARTAPPVARLDLEIRDGSVTPSMSAVPKGSRVLLRVVNRGRSSVRLALAGYESLIGPLDLAPGGAWSGEFPADLPGEDFAWQVDGRPAGRLRVTGSHLVEGHR
ncbi:MAG: hypothetical protein HZB25_13115 [Candidatus Eisenbacteria bacterium]|nr:hypothetical protein [Candidatus Eisenbacteria bacterium]